MVDTLWSALTLDSHTEYLHDKIDDGDRSLFNSADYRLPQVLGFFQNLTAKGKPQGRTERLDAESTGRRFCLYCDFRPQRQNFARRESP